MRPTWVTWRASSEGTHRAAARLCQASTATLGVDLGHGDEAGVNGVGGESEALLCPAVSDVGGEEVVDEEHNLSGCQPLVLRVEVDGLDAAE